MPKLRGLVAKIFCGPIATLSQSALPGAEKTETELGGNFKSRPPRQNLFAKGRGDRKSTARKADDTFVF
jgi:hypothetical protein